MGASGIELKIRHVANILEHISLLYVSLDRKLQEHFIKVAKHHDLISDSIVADVAYLLRFLQDIRELLNYILTHVYAQSTAKLKFMHEACASRVVLSLLSRSYVRRLIPVITTEISFNFPEYKLLKCFLVEISKRLQKFIKYLKQNEILSTQPWLEPVFQKLLRLHIIVYKALTSTFLARVEEDRSRSLINIVERRISQGLCPRIFAKLVEMYKELEKLNSICLRITKMCNMSNYEVIAYWINPYRLYEIYTFFLLLYVLNRFMTYVGMYEGRRATYFVFSKLGKTIYVAYNQRDELVNRGTLVKVMSTEGKSIDYIEKFLGIPDIVLKIVNDKEYNERYIIFDCKFRFNVSSIVESRYKVLGYLVEFDVNDAVLVFPRPRISKSTDLEARVQHTLIRETIKKGVFLEYDSKLRKRLTLLCVDPEDRVQQNIEKVEKVLKILEIV